MRRAVLVGLVFVVSGCGAQVVIDDAGVVSEVDSGSVDDAGLTPDAGVADGGANFDAGEADAGVNSDAGEVDAGGSADAGVEPDAGDVDDAGLDAGPSPDAGNFDIDAVATQASLQSSLVAPAAFSATISFVDAVAPIQVTVINGALPTGTGLTANPSAAPQITGAWNASVPADEAATFTLQARDALGRLSGAHAFSLALPPFGQVAALDGGATSLGPAKANQPYAERFVMDGGVLPLSVVTTTFPSVVAGGILFAPSTLSFSGTPASPLAPTAFSFTFRDGVMRERTQNFGLTVAPAQALTLSPAAPTLSGGEVSLPDAEFSAAYAQSITVAPSGVAPYALAVSGTFATGVTAVVQNNNSATATVLVSGTATSAADLGTRRNVTVTAVDAFGTMTQRTYNLRLIAPPPSISTTSLGSGRAGVLYSDTLTATGGTGVLQWSIVSGAVAGLTLSSSGALGGTPAASAAGNAATQVSFRVSDSFTDRVTGAASPRAATRNIALLVKYGYRVNVYPQLVVLGCPACHAAGTRPDFDGTGSSGSENAIGLVSVAAGGGTVPLGASSLCGGAPARSYVIPGSPSTSLLAQKITGGTPPPCGACMPYGACGTVTTAQRQLIQDWISSIPAAPGANDFK